jgi:hypothetical protein
LKNAWKYSSTTDKIAVASGAVPYVGDYVGLAVSTAEFGVDPSLTTFVDVLGDGVGAILPFVPALGTARRVERATEKGLKAEQIAADAARAETAAKRAAQIAADAARAETAALDAAIAERKVGQKVEDASEAKKKLGKTAEKGLSEGASSSSDLLKFGENDLVYGPSAKGELRKLQEKAGGKLLNDLEKPLGKTFEEFTLETLDRAAATGQKVHFDLTYVKDLDNLLAGKGQFAEKITSQELRHIAKNWEKFKDVVTFYKDGKAVQAPWIK